jgi:hypothetical protein
MKNLGPVTYVVYQRDGQWQVTAMEMHISIAAVRSGRADSHFADVLEASRRAEELRHRDGQPSHVVLKGA